jgi:hypothetical protein
MESPKRLQKEATRWDASDLSPPRSPTFWENGESPYCLRKQQRQLSPTTTDTMSCSPTSPPDSSKRFPRQVSFSPHIYFGKTVNREYFSEKESQEYWYTRQDLFDIKERNFATAKLMELGNALVQEGCVRGLETWTKDGQFHFKKRVWQGVDAVLDEQRSQVGDHVNDPPFLARIYRDACRQSKQIGRAVAQGDERQAKTWSGLEFDSKTNHEPKQDPPGKLERSSSGKMRKVRTNRRQGRRHSMSGKL